MYGNFIVAYEICLEYHGIGAFECSLDIKGSYMILVIYQETLPKALAKHSGALDSLSQLVVCFLRYSSFVLL